MNEHAYPSLPAAQPEPAFAALVGIDWADKKHYWKLQTAEGQREQGELDNTPEAVEVWMAGLLQRFGQRPLAVALEQRRGPLVVLLSKYGSLHLYPVHPLTVARYREAWASAGGKNDASDAGLLLEILAQHRDRLRRLDPDTEPMRLLQALVENRRKLVDQRTAVSNRLTALLKLYFPQILIWFDKLDSPLVADLLAAWPTLPQLQQASPARLQKFFRQHRCQSAKTQQRLEQIRQAVPATADPAILQPSCLLAQVCLRQLAVLREAIQEFDKQIDTLARRQPDWALFDSLPGAGAVLAPRLMAALGSRRERYHSAAELQCFAGIAPVTKASGNSRRVQRRWACPTFLRQTFHEWAACTLPGCPWAKQYYQEQIAKNKSHHTAVRALAFKWIRILYRCWKDRRPYREELYLRNRNQRLVPLQALAKPVDSR